MGAHNLEVYWPGKLTPAEIRTRFDAMIREDLYEHGHDAYSGSWGTLHGGVEIETRAPFATVKEARDYVLAHTHKWEHALAVQFRDDDGTVRWFVGGWAAS